MDGSVLDDLLNSSRAKFSKIPKSAYRRESASRANNLIRSSLRSSLAPSTGKFLTLKKVYLTSTYVRVVGVLTDGAHADDVLATKASSDDSLGIDHVNRSKAGGGKGDSIFIR